MLFAGTLFTVTLWGHSLRAAEAWVALLVLSPVLSAFEAVLFRGSIQAGWWRWWLAEPAADAAV